VLVFRSVDRKRKLMWHCTTLVIVSGTLHVRLDREKVIWTWKADGHKKQYGG